MEAELEKHINQFGCERQQLRDKLVSDERRYRDLEDALRKARSDVEHFKKQLSEAHRIAMSQQSAPPPYPSSGPAQPPQSVSPTQSQYGLSSQSSQASHNKFHSTSYNSNTSTGGSLLTIISQLFNINLLFRWVWTCISPGTDSSRGDHSKHLSYGPRIFTKL